MSILGAAALLGGAGVISGALNAIGVSDANDNNLAASRETNAMNYKIWNEQKAYQTGERLETQQYNTPLAQRQRFQQAGINPYLALGQMDSGQTTAQSSPSSPSLVTPTYQPIRYGDILSNATNGVLSSLQMDSLGLDNESKRIALSTQLADQLLTLEDKRQRIINSNLDASTKRKQLDDLDTIISQHKEDLDFFRKTKSERVQQEKLRRKGMELDNDAKDLAKEYQRLQNKYFSRLSDKQIAVMNAQISDYMAKVENTRQMTKTERHRTFNEMLTGQGINMDNAQKRELFQYTERLHYYSVEKAKFDARISAGESESLTIGPVKWKPNYQFLKEHNFNVGSLESRY